MAKKQLTIGWLYPELMSTYGDRGNIITLKKRCEWRNIGVEIKRLDVGFTHEQLAACNLLFMGGAQDQQQKIVGHDLEKKASILRKMIENEIPGLYICGAYQFLGKYYKEADGVFVEGLDILDLYTENPGVDKPRLIGNVVVDARSTWEVAHDQKTTSYEPPPTFYLVGFENHGGRTYLGSNIQPLGKVVKGFGNNGENGYEGAVYKNSFGSYFHGPILPKNPHFADLLIKLALEKKYGESVELAALEDKLEWDAHNTMVKKILGR